MTIVNWAALLVSLMTLLAGFAGLTRWLGLIADQAQQIAVLQVMVEELETTNP